MEHPLGNWAVLDIETTGIDQLNDAIIDVGYLQFEGTTLVKRYSSLVRHTDKVSQFIQKLTGITSSMLKAAPAWSVVEPEVMEVFGHHIIAHNAEFEEKFLGKHFKKIDDGTGREKYEDSLYFLGLLFPYMSSLKLENFIVGFGLADHEEHRGYQDSVDLLKVLLIAISLVREDRELQTTLDHLFKQYDLHDYWYYKLFSLAEDEIALLAKEVDLDLKAHLKIALEFIRPEQIDVAVSSKNFSYEFTGANIKKIYSSVETIQKDIPGYRYRRSQEELSLRVGQSLKNNTHALVQAPTGTGKTLGYLIPSALFCMEEQKQVLIATGTKTLQHQAMKKDVPGLRKLLGLSDEELKIRPLIGSGNHLCELLFRQSVEEDLLTSAKSFEEHFTEMFYDLIFFHNARNDYDQQIVRGDLPFVFKRKIDIFEKKEKEIAVDFRSCTGMSCPFKNECSYIKGLREAKAADIVIGNHALMFSWPKSFPRPQHIIVDEAHKIEGETTSAFTFEVTRDDFSALDRSLAHQQGVGSLFFLLAAHEASEGASTEVINRIRENTLSTQQLLKEHLMGLEDKIESYFKKMPRYTDIFWNELPMIIKDRADQLGLSIFNHFDSLRFILSDYVNSLTVYQGMWDIKELQDENQIIAFTRFEKFMGTLADNLKALEVSLGIPELKSDYTRTIKFHGEYGYSLTSAPINVGKVLHDGLLETSASVLFTSATLGNAKGDRGTRGIEWSTGYTYLESDRRFKSGLYLPATYDYKNKTKVFLCDDTLPIYDRSFVEQTLKSINKLIKKIGGKTLLLFSARSRFEVAREILLDTFEGEIPLFIQGMGNNVVEDFKNSGGGILLGMESFGEGIDIPGDALEFVFIDKIPDIRMDLVIQDRRDFYESNIGNEFTDYYLSHRTRALHQKMGRLIRTESDRGGVIIVDGRIKKWKGRTMENLLKLMEPYEINRAGLDEACLEIERFINNEQ